MERQVSSTNACSLGSLEEQLDAAYLKLENDLLKEEVVRMEVHLKQLEKNKTERLVKLEKLQTSRQKCINKLKDSLDTMKQQKSGKTIKTKCKYKWKCWWPNLCSFDHSCLYKKVNNFTKEDLEKENENAKVVATESKDGPILECQYCKLTFKTQKKLRKHDKKITKISVISVRKNWLQL